MVISRIPVNWQREWNHSRKTETYQFMWWVKWVSVNPILEHKTAEKRLNYNANNDSSRRMETNRVREPKPKMKRKNSRKRAMEKWGINSNVHVFVWIKIPYKLHSRRHKNAIEIKPARRFQHKGKHTNSRIHISVHRSILLCTIYTREYERMENKKMNERETIFWWSWNATHGYMYVSTSVSTIHMQCLYQSIA